MTELEDPDARLTIPLGRPQTAAKGCLPWLYAGIVIWVLLDIIFGALNYFILGPSKVPGLAVAGLLPILPFGAFVLYLRSVSIQPVPAVELSNHGVVLLNSGSATRIDWSSVTRVRLMREYDGAAVEPFPALVIEGAGARHMPPDRIALQPAGFPTPEVLQQCLFELLGDCPRGTLDVEVALLLGLVQRIVLQREQAHQGEAITAVSPIERTVLLMRRANAASTAPVIAPFEYFLGNVEKARGQCVMGLASEPRAWDLLLCKSLCERALGDDGAYRILLGGALEASSRVDLAAVLVHALDDAVA